MHSLVFIPCTDALEKISGYSVIGLIVNCPNYRGQSPLPCEGIAQTHGLGGKVRERLSACSAPLGSCVGKQLGRETRTCSPSPAPPVPVGASRRQSGQQEPPLPFQDGSGEQRGTQLAGGTVSSGDTAREAPVCWEWGGRAAPNRSVGLSLGRALSQSGCDPHRREQTPQHPSKV